MTGLTHEAADEIERLRATVAGLRKSAALRVQFHAAELADMTAERDMWKDTLAQRDRELANARAADIHSCHADCTLSGCVNARLTAEYERAVEQAARNADEVLRLRDALELIAAPMRPDGTWNRERLACQQIAAAALEPAKVCDRLSEGAWLADQIRAG